MSKTPALIIIRGVPGSGKSYLAQSIADHIGDNRTAIIDPDAVKPDDAAFRQLSAALTADGVDARFHVYRYLRQKAYTAMSEGKVVVWNQAFIDFDGLVITIQRLQEYAHAHGLTFPVLITEVELDPQIAQQRIATRKATPGGHGPEAAVFQQFVDDYRSFAGRGYTTLTVRGDARSDVSAAEVVRTLATISVV